MYAARLYSKTVLRSGFFVQVSPKQGDYGLVLQDMYTKTLIGGHFRVHTSSVQAMDKQNSPTKAYSAYSVTMFRITFEAASMV